jgi:hypothetical protein
MKLLLGWLLYWLDPNFRRLVKAKTSGANSRVKTGETVIAVLKRGENAITKII